MYPTVIPDIAAASKGLLADYGASDRAVRNQKPDVPYDSDNPLFEFGFGLRYK